MSEREPTADELSAMAYADGELAPQERGSFESRLAREPALRAQVAELRRLDVLAREFAPPEPLELAVQAIERSPTDKWIKRVGCTLLVLGTVPFWVWAAIEFVRMDGPWLLKAGVAAIVLGFALLFGRTVWIRARTRHLDPYRSVKR